MRITENVNFSAHVSIALDKQAKHWTQGEIG